MFANLKQKLRKRSDLSEDDAATDTQSEIAQDNVTHLTPTPLPPKIGEMSDLAEAAVDELANTLTDWFENDLQTLITAWQRLENDPNNKTSQKDLFRAAHNLSGMGETYGQPEVGRLCKSLCKLLELPTRRNDLSLISLHVDACRAVRSASPNRTDAASICAALEAEVNKLRAA